jgi:hypothetical protein
VSPRDKALWLAMQRRASSLSPDLARELLDAYRIIRESLSDAELTRLITSGQLESIVDKAVLERAFAPVRQRIVEAVQRGFHGNVSQLPKAGTIDGELAVTFDLLSPDVITAVRELDSRVINTLRDDVRDTVRAIVENGLRDGDSHKTIARDLRSVIGLSPTQAENVQKYRAKLEGLTRSPLSQDQIDKKVAAYERRAIRLNADTNARTATLDSLKLGQTLSWQDAVDNGLVDPNTLWKRWTSVGDDRVRDEHVAMNGEEVPFNDSYSNGEYTPGESTYNCRCISRVFVKRASPSLIAA